MRSFLLPLSVFIASFSSNAQSDFTPIKELALRRVPWLADHLEFSSIPRENGKDVYILSTKRDKVKISASDISVAGKALGYYLKNYCFRSMSHTGDNLAQVKLLPKVTIPIKIVSNVAIRYALNYCTISYTMSFYKWEDWEHELDWMSLNGVNLALATVGMEAVWQNTLKRIGCSDSAITQFIPGPAFSAWWLMGNLEGWGGPVTQGMIDRQVILQKKILARMKGLGIRPVMQGFYGMVPENLTNNGFQLLEQGQWGSFQRPALVKSRSDFDRLATIYYAEMKKLYGDEFFFFAGDPFHEGGVSEGVDIAGYGKWVQDKMLESFPGSTWLLQGWEKNPSAQLLKGLDKKAVLIQDLFGENVSDWFDRNGFEGTPFLWCTVSNFGEKEGLYGKLHRFAQQVYRIDTSRYAPLMQGVGIMPEGLGNNPVVYEFVLDLAWSKGPVNVEDWIKSFIRARYGKEDRRLQNAWSIFLATVYSSFRYQQEGPPESVFCARPSLKVGSVSAWGTRARNYDRNKFKEGVKLFVAAAGGMENCETYHADKIDFVRQVVSDKGEELYEKMCSAFEERNRDLFIRQSSWFLDLIRRQDSLLNCSKQFQLHTWLKQAWEFGVSPYEKKLALKNAKTQISYWGPDDPKTILNEYANKEWSGLIRSLYLPRWEGFVSECISKFNGADTESLEYFSIEKTWTGLLGLYPPFESSAYETEMINKILKD